MIDVVVAPATPWGHSALALIRLSGEGLERLLARVFRPFGQKAFVSGRPRRVYLFDDEGDYDDGVLLFQRGPSTYTGEDCAEVSCHGNPLIVERFLAAAVAAGAKMAAPGEFTRRALMNGKLDIIGAEAVLQATHANTSQGLKIARSAMSGELSAEIAQISAGLRAQIAWLEAALDFPTDEVLSFHEDDLRSAVRAICTRCESLVATFDVGQVLIKGARVALVGPVNAGKSSLFNALIGRARALVHDRPGTTRDVLEMSFIRDGISLTLLDTAGERPTEDPIEAAGLALAQELTEEADMLLIVLRAKPGPLDSIERAILERTAHRRRLIIYNGVDRLNCSPAPAGSLSCSAKTGEGVDALFSTLKATLISVDSGESRLMIASARQRDLFSTIASVCHEAIEALPVAGLAVCSELLIEALSECDALTGEQTRERVLDTLFANFCIGK